MNESELIVRARRGDEAAYSLLVASHQEAAFRLAYLITGRADEAEDAAQVAFIRALDALDRFDESRPFRPWLLSITRNVARNRLRSAARYVEAVRRAFAGSEELAATNPGGVEERAGQATRADRLWAAVRELRPDDQEIIYLRYFLDAPVDEAAATLGIAPGTVKSRLSRALDRLRAVVERSYPDLREEFEA